MNNLDLSIVVPLFNETRRVHNIESIFDFFSSLPLNFEIIAVDDGSTDNTYNILFEYKKEYSCLKIVKHASNLGKGAAVRHGVLIAQGDKILFTDIDLSTPLSEFFKLDVYLPDFDVVIASRALKDSKIEIHQPFYRELMGRIFNFLVKQLSLVKYSDTQCGFKLFKKSAAHAIFKRQTIDGFAFDVEVLTLTSIMNFKVKEVGVKWINSFDSKVKIHIHPFIMLYDLINLRLKFSKYF